MIGRRDFFSCRLFFFPYSRVSSYILRLFILFHSCCSHAELLFTTLVHEFHILYNHVLSSFWDDSENYLKWSLLILTWNYIELKSHPDFTNTPYFTYYFIKINCNYLFIDIRVLSLRY